MIFVQSLNCGSYRIKIKHHVGNETSKYSKEKKKSGRKMSCSLSLKNPVTLKEKLLSFIMKCLSLNVLSLKS